MQVQNVSAAQGAGALPTDFTATSTVGRDVAQTQSQAGQASPTPVAADVVSLSPEAALSRGAATAP
jgi:hypothetical protein